MTSLSQPGCLSGSKHRSLWLPPLAQSSTNGSLWSSRPICPLGDSKGFTRNLYNPRCSAVIGLFFSSGPTAVARFVVSVIVNSFQSQSARLCSHIGKKKDKRVPPIANRNAPTSVSFKPRNIWVSATRQHCSPNCVCGGRPVDCVPVSYLGGDSCVNPRASAAYGVARAEFFSGNDRGISALALAKPSNGPVRRPAMLANRGKSATLQAEHILEVATMPIRINASHNFLLARNSGQRRRGVISASSPRFLRDTSIVADCRMEAIYD